MADRRWHLEKHASLAGSAGAPKQPFTRPWGSQPMTVDLKTGALTGHPHPEQIPEEGAEPAVAAAPETPVQKIPLVRAYGR